MNCILRLDARNIEDTNHFISKFVIHVCEHIGLVMETKNVYTHHEPEFLVENVY